MKTIIGIIITIVVIAGIAFFIGNKKAAAPTQENEQNQAQEIQSTAAMPAPGNTDVQEMVVEQNQVTAITINNFAFTPAAITVGVGTTVTWNQQDTMPHTVTADDGSFGSSTLEQGQNYSHTFNTPGTYAYHCALHPTMKGTIIVQ